MTQLSFELDAPAGRRYECCGAPAPGFRDSGFPDFPHAEDCSNPNIGAWIDRYGRVVRRLHCGEAFVRGERPCPHDGTFRCPAGMVDPFDGACCVELHKNA